MKEAYLARNCLGQVLEMLSVRRRIAADLFAVDRVKALFCPHDELENKEFGP